MTATTRNQLVQNFYSQVLELLGVERGTNTGMFLPNQFAALSLTARQRGLCREVFLTELGPQYIFEQFLHAAIWLREGDERNDIAQLYSGLLTATSLGKVMQHNLTIIFPNDGKHSEARAYMRSIDDIMQRLEQIDAYLSTHHQAECEEAWRKAKIIDEKIIRKYLQCSYFAEIAASGNNDLLLLLVDSATTGPGKRFGIITLEEWANAKREQGDEPRKPNLR